MRPSTYQCCVGWSQRIRLVAGVLVLVCLLAAVPPSAAHARLVRVDGSRIVAVSGSEPPLSQGVQDKVEGGGAQWTLATRPSGVRVHQASGGTDLSFAFRGGFSAFDSAAEQHELAQANEEASNRKAITEDDFNDVFDGSASEENIDSLVQEVVAQFDPDNSPLPATPQTPQAAYQHEDTTPPAKRAKRPSRGRKSKRRRRKMASAPSTTPPQQTESGAASEPRVLESARTPPDLASSDRLAQRFGLHLSSELTGAGLTVAEFYDGEMMQGVHTECVFRGGRGRVFA